MVVTPFIALDWGTTNRRAYRVEDGRIGLERLDRVVDGRQLLELDLDQAGGVGGDVGVVGDDRGDRVADIADDIIGEDRLVTQDRPEDRLDPRQRADLRPGQDQPDAGDSARGGHVDPDDARVRRAAADELRMEHPGQHDVDRIRDAAPDPLASVDHPPSPHRFDRRRVHGCPHRASPVYTGTPLSVGSAGRTDHGGYAPGVVRQTADRPVGGPADGSHRPPRTPADHLLPRRP